MADVYTDTPTETAPSPIPLEDSQLARPRRRRPPLVPLEDREGVVETVLRRISTAQDERADWIEKRLARYAKLRGWLERDNPPWDDASNTHVPVMLANKLRVDAGLYNAVLGMRPVMKGTPTRPEHADIAEKIDHLLDYQMFVENEGDRRIEKFIDQFTTDGTVFSFQPWVRETGCLYDTRTIPRPKLSDPNRVIDTATLDSLVTEQVGSGGFTSYDELDRQGYGWIGYYTDTDGRDRECRISVYDHAEDEKDTRIDVTFEWDVTTYDGPSMIVFDLEDIVAPMRSENLQPITGHNPTGAPWAATLGRTPLDAVRRNQKNGIYDLLTAADIEELEGVLEQRTDEDVSHNEKALKEQRDQKTGLQPQPTDDEKEWLRVVVWYGCYDGNRDGLDEDVIFTVIEGRGGSVRKLARARYLTEQYPGLPPRRPFAEARFIPIPGQLYGMGIVELMEGLHDLLHVLFNQNIDYGSLATLPFFAYRASSGFKPDTQRLEPGIGIPLDNPQQDLFFPPMPAKDQSWHFNTIGLAMQFLERLVQMGAMNFGQVPQGKASALRTSGNMMALLQQSGAMPEQILRRLFLGLRDVYGQFHLLNIRFLPPKKRYLVTGQPPSSEQAYGMIDDRKEISVPVSFDFQATLLNTNKGVVAQALSSIGQAIFSPIAFQLKLVDAETFYNWAKDLIQANERDPSRYLKRPPGVSEAPKITAQEAILMLLEGLLPTDHAPLEPPQEHLQYLMKYMQSDDFAHMGGGKELLFKQYIQYVMGLVQQQMQAQQMQDSAAQFSQMLSQGNGGGPGGAPGTPQMPPMQSQAPAMDEIQGAELGAVA